MAKINNSAVIQKLIDELLLYPGTDVIPTELAEKILPVFQINSQDVNVSIVSNPVLFRDTTANDNDKTFTVPLGKKWKILNFMAKYVATATAGSRGIFFRISDDNSEIMFQIGVSTSITASQTRHDNYVPGAWTSSSLAEVASQITLNNIYPIPEHMILLEGWTIRYFDSNNVDVNDDLTLTLEVDEQST